MYSSSGVRDLNVCTEIQLGMYPKDGNQDREYETTMELGEVATTEDMLLVFPNFLQHKVSDFRLLDETRPGSRKILCFFLINPYEQVCDVTSDIKICVCVRV